MLHVEFYDPHTAKKIVEIPSGQPKIIVADVTSLAPLNATAFEFFSTAEINPDSSENYYLTIEDFDKIGLHLIRVNFVGNFYLVILTGSESGDIVYYNANMVIDHTVVKPYEQVKVIEMPKMSLADGQTVGVSEMPAVALQAGQSIDVKSMPAIELQQGQSVNVGTLPAVNIAAGQSVGLVEGTKVGVSAIDSLPAVNIAAGQSVGLADGTKVGVSAVESLPAVSIAADQEVGLKAGSVVGIDGAIQATIANDQAIGVYPVRRS